MSPCAETEVAFEPLPLSERYGRQELLRGWSQDALREAKVLVVGAGALGNEVLKNLALLGVGTLGIVDRDSVEFSNLSRSVLFRDTDVGRRKVECAATSVAHLNPEVSVYPIHADLTCELGAGTVAPWDIVLGCLDSIKARWKLNRLCEAASTPWIDAGIEGTGGQIAFFESGGPCYECGMTGSMWERLYESRSCRLGQRSVPSRPIATTATLVSVVAGLQVQEALAQIHRRSGMPWTTLAAGDRLTVSLAPYSMAVLHAKRNPECLAHEAGECETVDMENSPEAMTAENLLNRYGMDALELDWDVAIALDCAECGAEPICEPSWRLASYQFGCPRCSRTRRAEWRCRIESGDREALRTLAALGVPPEAYLSLVTNDGRRLRCRLQRSEGVRI
jgi:molybdopterin/thiamine biosynthesis adenylyltransferase